jgi:hypothetical protein
VFDDLAVRVTGENQVLNWEPMRAYEDWFYADLSPNLLTVESLK